MSIMRNQSTRTQSLGREASMARAYPVGEAAKELGVSPSTVRNWVEKGYLMAVRLPSGHRRIPESELTRMLAQLFSMPEPTEESEARRVVAGPVGADEWGPDF